MNLINEFKNDLLGRMEVEFAFSSSTNLGIETVTQMIADENKINKNNICVKSLKGHYGLHDFTVEAFIYDSLEQKDKVEPKKKEKKK